MHIRGRDVNEGDIERQGASIGEESRDFAQEDRGVVGSPFLHGAADVWTDEERVVAEATAHLWFAVCGRTGGVHVHDLDVAEVGAEGDQPIDKDLRGGRATVDVNAIGGLNQADSTRNIDELHEFSMAQESMTRQLAITEQPPARQQATDDSPIGASANPTGSFR